MAAGVSDVLVMVEVGLVNLLEVVEAGKLLLGFGVSGKLVILDTSWVLTEWVLVHVSLLGLCVLVKTVLMGTVPVLTEVGASVMMLVGSVSRTEVEVSACVGNTVVILVGLGGVVAITVVEVKTVSGMVGVDGTVLLGSISIHGVVGEVGTIVTDIDSGHGVVEETVTMGVVSVEEVIREDVIGEVLVVLDETEVGKVVTEEEPGLSVLEELMEVGSIELTPVEEEEDDIDTVDIEEEMIVLKEVVIALVDVPTTGNEDVGETLEVLYGVVRIDVVAMLVDTVLTIWEVDRVGKLAVIEVADAAAAHTWSPCCLLPACPPLPTLTHLPWTGPLSPGPGPCGTPTRTTSRKSARSCQESTSGTRASPSLSASTHLRASASRRTPRCRTMTSSSSPTPSQAPTG